MPLLRKPLFLLLYLAIFMAIPSCGPAKVVSYDNFGEAQTAFYKYMNYDIAIEYVNRQIAETPTHSDSYYLRAMAFYSNKKYDSALKDFDNAIKYFDSDTQMSKSRLFYCRGKTYSKMGRINDAIVDYEQAVKGSKWDSNTRTKQNYKFHLAWAYYDAGRISQAEAVFRDMLNDNPQDVAAMEGLAAIGNTH